MLTTIITALLLVLVMVWSIYRMRFFKLLGIKQRSVMIALAMKFIAGCLVVFVYTYIHKERSTADVYKFMDDAAVLHEIRKEDPLAFWQLVSGIYNNEGEFETLLFKTGNWNTNDQNWLRYAKIKDYNPFNSNRFVTRVNALLWFITNGNIWLHVLCFSYLGLLGLIAFFHVFSSDVGIMESRKLLFIFLCFMPGTLLWCSAPLKDTLVITFTGLFFYYFKQSKRSKSFRLIACLMLVFLLLYLKYYIASAIILFLIFYVFLKLSKSLPISTYYRSLLLLFSGFALIYLNHYLGLFPDVFAFLNDKRMESLKNAVYADAGTYLFNLPVQSSISQLTAILIAPINALYFPFVPDLNNKLLLIHLLENWFLIALTIVAIKNNLIKKVNQDFYASLIVLVLSLAFIIGYTTPLAGNIVRYKTVLLPLLMGLFFYLTDEEKRRQLIPSVIVKFI